MKVLPGTSVPITFLVVTCLCKIVSAHYFAVFGPRTVQHREKFKVLLTAHDDEEMVGEKIKVSLTGKELNDNIATHDIELEQMHRILEFNLEHSSSVQNYILKAKSGNFEQSVEIFVIPKRYSVLVQTDKPQYHPGDKVNFRVLIVNSEMKSFNLTKMSVHILDRLGNVFQQFNVDFEDEEKFSNGVFTDSFNLAEESVMDEWNIKVMTKDKEDDSDDVVTLHSFQVTEYVLPRFSVTVETKTDVFRSNTVPINLKVYANYTFGELVNGTVDVLARTYDSESPGVVKHVSETKTVDVETQKTISFNMTSDLGIKNAIRPYFAVFEVNFTEALTGQKMPAKDVKVRISKVGDYLIEFSRQEKRFKPGYHYNFTTHVKGIYEHLTRLIEVTVLFYYTPQKCTLTSQLTSLEKTFALSMEEPAIKGKHDYYGEFSVMIPTNTTAITITAKFAESEGTINVMRQESNSREYIRAVITKKAKIGTFMAVRFEGNAEDVKQFYVLIHSRMGIVHFGNHSEFSKEEKFTKIKVTSEMAPTSFLTVYYIQMTGEIVSDQIRLDIEKPLPLKFEIKLKSTTVSPGSKVSMKLIAANGAIVSILGVDESVTLLGTGNDIDKARLLADMSSYNIFEKLGVLKIKGNNKRYLDFGESNSFILTNALEGTSTCLSPRFGIDATEIAEVVDPQLPEESEDDNETEPPEQTIRTRFLETWLFSSVTIEKGGQKTVQVDAPDTITSFLISGFAMHPTEGLGIAVQQKVKVFKKFFLKLYLPYSIRFDEVLKVDVSIFNYEDEAVKVDVKMHNLDKEFKFVNAKAIGTVCDVTDSTEKDKDKRQVTIQPNSGTSTYFLVKALKTGMIKIKVAATKEGHAIDEVQKDFKVEHEGIVFRKNKPILFDLRNKTQDSYNFNLVIATTHIPNSLNIKAEVIGDLFGPAFNNIDNLIAMPSGCTEQMFKSWIPNISAMKYLKAIGKLATDVEKKGEAALLKGYQEVLKRKQADGSYSMWSETGAKSTWLTAYVAKCLGHSKEFLKVNDLHIFGALNFVKGKQTTYGNYSDPVATYYYISKTKSQTGIGLTAFAAIAFVESGYYNEYKDTVDKSLDYIHNEILQLGDNFAIAISAYALILGSREKDLKAAKELVVELDRNAQVNSNQMYWNFDNPSIKVEIASYAMMAYFKVGRGREALKILNWLMTQRNEKGGFFSTTDTVIGIQALTMLAEAFHAEKININGKFSYENDTRIAFKIDSQNARELQPLEIKQFARRINCVAEGSGIAFIQVSYRYNTNMEQPQKRFNLRVIVQDSGNDNLLHLRICTQFIADGENKQSQMALIEIKLPSGYVYDPETSKLVEQAGVRRTETEDKKTRIILYFDSIGSETEVCPEIKAIRKYVIADPKKSVVKVYDYNNQEHRASAFYQPSTKQPCGF